MVALATLAALTAGCSSGSPVSQRSLAVGVESPPPPPRGALVLGGESGSRAVALAVGKRRLTATVLAPSGGPLSGLKVAFRAGSRLIPAQPCGLGCYSARARRPRHVEVRLSGSRPVAFDIPASSRPAAQIVARASRATRALKSLVYTEALRSGPTGGLLTTWSLQAPNEVEYRIRGGAEAIVLGDKALGPRSRGRAVAPFAAASGAAGAGASLGLPGDERLFCSARGASAAARSGSSPSPTRPRRPGSRPGSTSAPRAPCACT